MTAAARKLQFVCAIYTRVSTESASIRTSTRSMPSTMRRRPISEARPMQVDLGLARPL